MNIAATNTLADYQTRWSAGQFDSGSVGSDREQDKRERLSQKSIDPASSTPEPGSDEARQLQQLKARDREVRQHEAAHVAAGGQYVTSGAQFQYQKGPDGQQYAVGGEVQIDTSPVRGDPEATAAKMQVVIRAAMAPAEPSGQDRAVAAQAAQTAASARMEAAEQRLEKQSSDNVSRAYRDAATGPLVAGEQIDIQA